MEKVQVSHCEPCEPVDSFVEGMAVSVFSTGYGTDVFWKFMMDMIHSLNGNDNEYNPPKKLTGGYGVSSNGHYRQRLFQTVEFA